MKRGNQFIRLSATFQDTLNRCRKAIIANDFLLIQEIDTQGILGKHGISIPPLRQLLFFHPLYMQNILENAPDAVIEAPLKLVIQEFAVGETEVHFFDVVAHFEGYEKLAELAEILSEKTRIIIQMIGMDQS